MVRRASAAESEQRRKKIVTFVLLVILLVSASLFLGGPTEPELIIVEFPNGKTMETEVASTPEKLLFGLAFREGLPADTGMLYIFESTGLHRVQTRQFRSAVDMVWIDESHHVVHILEQVPGWYPILAVYDEQGWRTDRVAMIGDSVYSEMAFYDVAISAPADWVVAATGMQVDEANISPTQIRHIFVSGPARDFFIAASPDFKVASQRSRETTVNSYYLPGNENGGNQALQVGVVSIEIFNKNFGLYPYNELDIIQAPMRNAGGVEFPGIVLIEAGGYDEPGNPAFITTVAHEAAHQWWYNIVGNDVFSEPWLDEGPRGRRALRRSRVPAQGRWTPGRPRPPRQS